MKILKYDEDPEVEYNVSTAQVERIVISDKEFIKFNLTTMKQLKRLKVCDIGVAIIDGMGEEHKNKFRMKDNYKSVVDLSTNTKLKIKNNFISLKNYPWIEQKAMFYSWVK